MPDDGQTRYPNEDFLKAVQDNSPASTGEVAKQVGCTRRNADIRLRKLAEQGKINRKKIAATQVWTVASETQC
jgi:DNA-binding Lrp family transcriptional regulator